MSFDGLTLKLHNARSVPFGTDVELEDEKAQLLSYLEAVSEQVREIIIRNAAQAASSSHKRACLAGGCATHTIMATALSCL